METKYPQKETQRKSMEQSEGKTIQRLPYLGVQHMYSHQTQNFMLMQRSAGWQEPDIAATISYYLLSAVNKPNMLFLKFAFFKWVFEPTFFLSQTEKCIDTVYVVIILNLIMAYEADTNENFHNFSNEVWEIQNPSEMKFILT